MSQMRMRPQSGGNTGALLQNIVLFARLLRGLGIQVTPTQIVDLVEALQLIDLRRREDVKNVACSLLVNRREHLELFGRAFDLFWQAREQDALTRMGLGLLLRRRPQSREEPEMRPGGTDGHQGPEGESEEPKIEKVYTFSPREVLRQKDFGRLTEEELTVVREMMQEMAWDLKHRRTRRKVRAPRGPYFDLRRTFRQNLRYGAEPLHLARRRRKYKRRPIVVICDISGSMERYSRVLLQFLYVITNRLEKVETFVFSTRLTRITRHLRRRHVDEALNQATRAIQDWAGGTRIGEALKTFNYQWARRVLGQGAVVLIISDGWDRGDVDLLAREMDRLQRSCHRLIWLNPLLGSPNYEPLTRGIQAALPFVDYFLPVHNLESLEQLGGMLERLSGHRPVRRQKLTTNQA